MASRSVDAAIANQTQKDLTYVQSALQHGIWSNNGNPPSTIAAGTTGHAVSESSGLLTGVEGWVEYQIVGETGLVRFAWNNPYDGSNAAGAACTLPNRQATASIPKHDDNASATFTIS